MRQINYYMADDNRLIRVVIVDGTIDEVAELECLSIVEESDEEEEEAEEEVEEAKPAKKQKKSEGKRFEPKPCCGSKGARHMKDCPGNKQEAEEDEEKEEGDKPYVMDHGVLSSHQEKISAMWDAGKSEEQIYNAMYQHMTTEEFRKAMDHAKL